MKSKTKKILCRKYNKIVGNRPKIDMVILEGPHKAVTETATQRKPEKDKH
jgi:hypothetical protein